MYVEKVKRKKDMFDDLSIFQRVLTLIFFFNTKVFYQNYFTMRINYDWQILIQLEVFIEIKIYLS